MSQTINSGPLLDRMKIRYKFDSESESKPEKTGIKFKDILPDLDKGGERSKEIHDRFLYEHQLRALRALEEGKNVILVSGTGSGKLWSISWRPADF